MAPRFFDLTWIPTTAIPELPADRTGAKDAPYLGDAVYRGDPYSITFTLPGPIDGTITAQIRAKRITAGQTVGDPLAEWSVDVDGDDITIALTPEQTAALPDQSFWDVQQWDGDEPIASWLTGKVKAWGDVTREAAA